MEILLVDDNAGDIELMLEAFKDSKSGNCVHATCDGEAALDFLYRRSPYGDAPRPDIILLDLNMPRMNGKEVLKLVKADEALRDIPVIVLTSSQAEQDIARSYQLHANAYIVKPADFAQTLRTVRAVEDFWLSVVTLPSQRKKRARA